MHDAEFIHCLFIDMTILQEVTANVLIKYSDGFHKCAVGALGISCILASFTALSQAAQGIELSIAYVLWGGTGILLTASAARLLFQQRLSRVGWSGISAIVLGMLLLKLS